MPDTIEAPLRTRGEIKEACKMAFISGRATLAELSVREDIPYNTLQRWSSDEKWAIDKQAVLQRTEAGTVDKVAEWLKEQRERQIKRALGRMERIQSKADEILPNVDNAKDLLAVSNAEQVADLVIRRNLGMDSTGGNASGGVTVNVLGAVQIKGA